MPCLPLSPCNPNPPVEARLHPTSRASAHGTAACPWERAASGRTFARPSLDPATQDAGAHTQPPSGPAPPLNSRNPDSAGVVRIRRDHHPTSMLPAKRNPLSLHPFPRLFCTEPSPVTPCFPFPAVQKSPDSSSVVALARLKRVYPHRPRLIRTIYDGEPSHTVDGDSDRCPSGSGEMANRGANGKSVGQESRDVQTNNSLPLPLHHLEGFWP